MAISTADGYEFGHSVIEECGRYIGYTTEVWCERIDETITLMDQSYVRYCPMCGDEL